MIKHYKYILWNKNTDEKLYFYNDLQEVYDYVVRRMLVKEIHYIRTAVNESGKQWRDFGSHSWFIVDRGWFDEAK